MYPYVRAVWGLWRARSLPPMGPFDTHVTYRRAWPLDTDIFGELNNGRILTLFELGRWHTLVRMGVLSTVLKKGVMFPVAGVSLRYRRRVPVFQNYRMQTRFVTFDERFFYAEQSMWQGETCMNQLLLRAGLKDKNGSLRPADFMESLGMDSLPPEMPEWVKNWVDADATRPWPPESGPIFEN